MPKCLVLRVVKNSKITGSGGYLSAYGGFPSFPLKPLNGIENLRIEEMLMPSSALRFCTNVGRE